MTICYTHLLILLADGLCPLDKLRLVLLRHHVLDELDVSFVLRQTQILPHLVIIGAFLVPLGPDGSGRTQRARHVEFLVLAEFLHDLLRALEPPVFH